MKHSKPVEHLKHLEHLQHLKILRCPSVKHFQVLNRFKMKILSPALNDTDKAGRSGGRKKGGEGEEGGSGGGGGKAGREGEEGLGGEK